MNQKISRRGVAKGAAWSVPAVAVASAAPAVAASTGVTATSTAANGNWRFTQKIPAGCSSSNPAIGYIDAMPTNSPVAQEKNDNGLNSTNGSSSNGLWIESTNGGTVSDVTITMTFTYSSAVTLQQCPTNTSLATSGTALTWSSCNILNGWTATQVNATTIQVSYTIAGPVKTSTLTQTGWNTGFFLNVTYANCGNVYVDSAWNWSWTDANGVQTDVASTGSALIPRY